MEFIFYFCVKLYQVIVFSRILFFQDILFWLDSYNRKFLFSLSQRRIPQLLTFCIQLFRVQTFFSKAESCPWVFSFYVFKFRDSPCRQLHMFSLSLDQMRREDLISPITLLFDEMAWFRETFRLFTELLMEEIQESILSLRVLCDPWSSDERSWQIPFKRSWFQALSIDI